MKTFFLLLTAGIMTASAAQKIVGGPFVVNVTPKTATVVWIVESDSVNLRTPDGSARTSPSFRVEKTVMTGLQPNTRYEYDVAGQDAGKGAFKTAPTGAVPFQFVVYGDTRSRHDVHRRVVEALIRHGIPDFIVHTGDLVADGNDSSMWPVFFDIEKDLLRQTVFFPSLGNHERNSRDYYDFFQVESAYYSFNWGNAHFIILNSDVGNAAAGVQAKEAFWTGQTSWLEDDLKRSQNADYRFVIAHHPPFTAVSSRQGSNPHMTALVPMFEKYKVTAAFFGHDHNYQHHLKNGVHYVVTGGGGAPLYDVAKPVEGITQKVFSTEHFVAISVDGKAAHMQAIALDGRVLDEIDVKAAAVP